MSRRFLVPLLSVVAAVVLAAPAPAQYTLLSIVGEPLVGNTLHAEGLAPTPRWQREVAPDVWQDIADAASADYKVVRADHGHRLRVRSGPAFSAPTAVVRAKPVADVLPAWTGTAREGETLTGTLGEWFGTAPMTLAGSWLRCDAVGAGCVPIEGAAAGAYAVTAADVGHTLRVSVRASNEVGSTPAESPPTPVVVAREVAAEPGGSFGGSGTPPPVAPPPTQTGADPPPPFINPFPLIRVAGRFQGRLTRFTLVRVRAPRGVRVDIRCRGRSCPFDRRRTRRRVRRVKALERVFPSRTTIEFRVTLPGHIGKYTKIRIRRGAAPARIDRCLIPGTRLPVRCPGA